MSKLRIASCQFPVIGDISRNARYIRRYLKRAAESNAHILHTSEACLSGYARTDFDSFRSFDWELLRTETQSLRDLCSKLEIGLILGSGHFLDGRNKPTNCLYWIDNRGRIVDRYDKCMCTKSDQQAYSAGNRLVAHTVNGIKIGLAICYDVCYPQVYTAYRDLGAKIMLHSFYNARGRGPNCLDVLNCRQVPTRCADNQMWAIANNSSHPYSHWASFVARPDATIAQKLKINQAGMLIHEFPDGLSGGGWLHNHIPMKLAKDEILTFGKPSRHIRQSNGKAEP